MGQRWSPCRDTATADNAANDADDDAASAAAANDALPRFMPLIKEVNGSKGDEDDAPTTLLLAMFIQNFCFRINGPVIVAIIMVQRWGGHEPAHPLGGCQWWRKKAG
jgi:hypothetical protein